MFTEPGAHITLLHIMSIQPANKAVKHLISLYNRKKTEAVNAYLIKNSKGERIRNTEILFNKAIVPFEGV